ncbi:MAG TPA: hypothetical protein VM532_17700 [Burkholderiales bacterium]|nr:hypothetical protein [Burkholderiales bacterium]
MATKKTPSSAAKSSRTAAKSTTAKRGGTASKTTSPKAAKTTPSPRQSVTKTSRSAQAENPIKKDKIPAVQPAAKQPTTKKRDGSDADFFIKKKVVRDTFTMPIADYEKIDALKKKCLQTGIVVKKSELLRAGLAALELLSTEDLARTVGAVHAIKSGRPVSRRQQNAKDDDK